MNIEQIALETWREIHGFDAVFMRDAQVEFLRRCLAKLAAQDVEPIYQLCKSDSSFNSAWIDVDEQTYSDAGLYPEYGRRRLYHEAQLLTAQQRILELEKEVKYKQSQIDSLMLEYCPDEMTEEQLAEWAKHQAVSNIVIGELE